MNLESPAPEADALSIRPTAQLSHFDCIFFRRSPGLGFQTTWRGRVGGAQIRARIPGARFGRVFLLVIRSSPHRRFDPVGKGEARPPGARIRCNFSRAAAGRSRRASAWRRFWPPRRQTNLRNPWPGASVNVHVFMLPWRWFARCACRLNDWSRLKKALRVQEGAHKDF